MTEYEIVLSYHNALLRQADYKILCSNAWINDNLIEFWFEYLQNSTFSKFSEKLLCLGPSTCQLIKMCPRDIKAILAPLQLLEKELVLLPINDNAQKESVGGSHWSLLVLYVPLSKFEHYDSSLNSNNVYHAKQIALALNTMLYGEGNQLDMVSMQCNQQNDSYNCGVHLMCNASAVCRRYFENDVRHICQIATLDLVKDFRNQLRDLIVDLKSKQ